MTSTKFLIFIFLLKIRVFHLSLNDVGFAENFNKSSPPITIALDKTFDFNSEDFFVGEVGPVFIDPLNRVFICDTKLTKIHVFDPSGKLIESIGNQGKGPGDYSYISKNTFIHFSDTIIYITDTFGFYPHRAHAYKNSDLSYSHSLSLIPSNKSSLNFLTGYEIFKIYQINEKQLLVAMHKTLMNYDPSNNNVYWLVYELSDQSLNPDPILIQNGVQYAQFKYTIHNYEIFATHSFPFFTKPLHYVSNDGEIYTANSKKLLIRQSDFSGEHINSLEYEVSAPLFNRSWVRDLYIRTNYMPNFDRFPGERIIIKMLDGLEEIPAHWPEMEQFFVDDLNRIWVNTVTNPNEYDKWLIFNDSGEYVIEFDWNHDSEVIHLNSEFIYATTKNDLGETILLRFKYSF